MNYRLPLIVGLLSLASSVLASDLRHVLDAAMQADPEFAAAQQNWRADQQALTQGRAALMPSLNASYAYVRNETTLEEVTDIDQQVDNETTTVSLVQPLFRPESWHSYQQGKALTNIGQAQFAQAKQDFLLRVAQKYTDVLRAWDNLVAAQANERAIGRQREQTQERFDVGLLPITDVHEAQAVYDLARVNLIVSGSDFAVASDALTAFAGEPLTSIAGLKVDLPMAGPSPAATAQWVERAQQANPQLLIARFNAAAAKSVAAQGLSRQLPTVDLIGQYQNLNNLNEDFGGGFNFNPNRHSTSVGVEVKLPLFAGGSLNSRRLQASYRYQAAQQQYRLVHRDTSQSARSLTHVAIAAAQRVSAYRQAVVSAQSALTATESGYQVGTRNAVDVLNAQQALFEAQRDYAGARYDYIISSLQLKAVAGLLSEQDIVEINGWLSPQRQVQLEQ